MKIKNILFLLFCVLITSCGDDSEPPITLSQNKFSNVPFDQTSLEVEIRTSMKWTATSLASWCKVSEKQGSGDRTLKILLEPNIDKDRIGQVKIWTEKEVLEITIQQTALPAGKEYHYKIPVIFHVLYKNQSDNKQYVSQTRLAEILENVNAYYRGETLYNGGDAGVDTNLEFVLAEYDENGEKLSSPGVEYVKFDDMPLDCESFMSDKRYVTMLWDPNQYINIMLYNFAEVDEGRSIILGISHLPFSVSGTNYLEGLPSTTYTYLTKENLPYPKCVSINSLYIHEDQGENGSYNSMNVNVTLAHELGHYLGLHHAFDESDDSGLSTQCINSDYCEDTPSYNRVAYMMNLSAMIAEANKQGKPLSMTEAVKRENCKTGQTFSSYNLMDYEISYSDRFTNDQNKRIRHVLTYSPLIPGPKKGGATTRSIIEGTLDLPMVIVK